MKTWWNLLPAIVLAIVIPFLIGILPTIEVNNKHLGGGPIRQYFINIVAGNISPEKSAHLVELFENATVSGEIGLYLPIALNMSLASLLFMYCIGYTVIEGSNYIKNNIYNSQRSRAKKGA